jgi:competence protein ComGB
MPTYFYQGIDIQGNKKRGCIGAPNIKEARKKVSKSDIDLLSLKKVRMRTHKQKNCENFFLYMSYAIQSKSTVLDALQVVQKSFSEEWGYAIQSIVDQVSQGKSLSTSCSCYDFFPDFVPSILLQGEKTGSLGTACYTCYELIQEMDRDKDSAIKILIQPMINFSFFILSLYLLITHFVPSVAVIFHSANIQQPLSMQILLFFGNHFLKVFFCLSIILLFFIKKIKNISLFKKIYLRKQYLAFFSSLHYLAQSHILIIDALNNIQTHTYNKKSSALSLSILNAIRKGKSLSQAVEMLPYFPKFYVRIIASGERTNKQQESLAALVKIMRYDNKKAFEQLTLWMGPLTIILLSLGLWAIIQSTFIPLYKNMGNIFYV